MAYVSIGKMMLTSLMTTQDMKEQEEDGLNQGILSDCSENSNIVAKSQTSSLILSSYLCLNHNTHKS